MVMVQKNLKEYFCDDIFEFGYLINQKKFPNILKKSKILTNLHKKEQKIWSITWVLVMGYPQKEPFAPLKKY